MQINRNGIFLTLFFSVLILISCAHRIEPAIPAKPIPSDEKPFLGIGFRAVSNLDELKLEKKISKGLKIIHVAPYSAARKAGLKTGDIIISYDSILFPNLSAEQIENDFRNYVTTNKKIGDPLLLSVIRFRTKITGLKDNDKIKINKRKELNHLLDHQIPGQHITIEADRQLTITDIEVILDKNPGIRTTPLPPNRLLFPEFESIDDPYADLTLNLIDDFNLQPKYNEMIDQLNNDERWDDGFRLSLIRYVRRDPLKLPTAADQTAKKLEKLAARGNICDFIQKASLLLDEDIEAISLPYPEKASENPQVHFDFIKTTIETAMEYRHKAFQKLTAAEQQFLSETLPGFLKDESRSKAFISSGKPSREENLLRIIQLAHEIDFNALLTSARILGLLADRNWLDDFQKSFRNFSAETLITVEGIQGDVLYAADTSAGMMVIGGRGSNRYDNTKANIIIDLGGDDIYLGRSGAASLDTPISVLIDLSGNDQYSATESISFGSGFLGTGILIDLAGDDVYTGSHLSQGTGLMGVGLLIDFQGDDHYMGKEYTQGTGIFGIGLLLDHDGDDHYQSDLIAQGVGGPKAIGALLDMQGDDTYHATGQHKSSYGTENIFNGMSQGFGFGFRNYTSGGIGLLIDADGNDFFHAGNFSQGGGYFFGLGILKNSGTGNDVYIGSRYAQGFSAHSAAGILIDDGGDDRYSGYMGAVQSAAWDMGVAALVDKAGNDTYNSLNLFFSKSASAHNGFSILIDREGKDNYLYTEGANRFVNHNAEKNSLSILIDNGGAPDLYNGSLMKNNKIFYNGSNGLRIDLDQDIKDSLRNMVYRVLIRK